MRFQPDGWVVLRDAYGRALLEKVARPAAKMPGARRKPVEVEKLQWTAMSYKERKEKEQEIVADAITWARPVLLLFSTRRLLGRRDSTHRNYHMAKPKTVTTQYMDLFSHRSVALPAGRMHKSQSTGSIKRFGLILGPISILFEGGGVRI